MMLTGLGPIVLFLSLKTSERPNIAATWHVVPDIQICPKASSFTFLFTVVDFREKTDRGLRKARGTKEEKVSRRVHIYFQLKCVLYLFKGTG